MCHYPLQDVHLLKIGLIPFLTVADPIYPDPIYPSRNIISILLSVTLDGYVYVEMRIDYSKQYFISFCLAFFYKFVFKML